MTETELGAGDTVRLSVDAEVVCRYESGRVKIRWHSGEEIISTSDHRLTGVE